jgi:hypothetical protein
MIEDESNNQRSLNKKKGFVNSITACAVRLSVSNQLYNWEKSGIINSDKSRIHHTQVNQLD